MANGMTKLAAVTALTMGVAVGIVAIPGTAQAGFLDQLFGGSQQSAPSYGSVPSYGYDSGEQRGYAVPSYRAHRPKKRVAADGNAGKQKTTDLMHDASLRPGDAVMLKDGIHIYEGERASAHDNSDFVALDQADVPNKQKELLVAVDVTRNDPLRGPISPNALASGRSAAVATPINAGYKITDARGKPMRYVGP